VAEEEGCDGDDARERTCLHGLSRRARVRPSVWFSGDVAMGAGRAGELAMRVGL
jgi:hypothetical protein